MSLSDYEPPMRSVPIGKDNDVTVRALSVADIGLLMRAEPEELNKAVSRFKDQVVASEGEQELTSLIGELIGRFPMLCALLISVAADEPDQIDIASSIPFPTQLELVLAVYELTVEEAGGLKKLLETILSLMGVVRRDIVPVMKTGGIH